jgi:hypothetical protein
MKERPILFSTAMVAAIIAGTKTQTRRTKGLEVINQNSQFWNNNRNTKRTTNTIWDSSKTHESPNPINTAYGFELNDNSKPIEFVICPYGQPHDLLYVREAWRLIGWDFEDGTMLIEYKDGKRLWMDTHDPTEDSQWLVDQVEKLWQKGCLGEDPEDPDKAVIIKTVPWIPSIHMPKAAARLWLLLEGIGAERLQDISEEDAIAEGIEKYGPFGEYKGAIHPNGGSMKFRAYERASRAFQDLWEGINGEDSWKINPWVWTLKFKELSKEGRPVFAKDTGVESPVS